MRAFRILILALVAMPFLAASSCSKDERVSQKLFEKGKRLEKARQYPQAAEIYKRIQQKYPQTDAARQIKNGVDFKFMEDAMAMDRLKNVNEVRDHLKAIAKAVENYNFKESKYPGTLDELVPAYIQALPRDPWGARYTYGPIDAEANILDPGASGVAGYMLVWFGRDRLPGGDGDDSDVFLRSGQFVATQ